jgi:molybdopterin converting factor small subunit
MKIISLSVSNIMKVTAAFIQPKSEVVVIQGENEAGKSTLLNSIVMAFGGDRVLPEIPLKKGSKKGEIVVKLDGDKSLRIPPFVITRSFTDKKAYVKIEPESVTAGETPRSFLDKLIGSISFDPLKFINEESKKQRKTLLTLIGIDPDEWDAKEKVAFDKRTEIGRELKVAEAKCKDRVVYDDVEETEEIKVGDLTARLQKAIAYNQDRINRINKNESLKGAAIGNKEMVEKLKKQIAELEETITEQRDRYKAEKDDLALSMPEDIDAINSEIQSIESKNSKIRHNRQVKDELREKALKDAAYADADAQVDEIRTDRLKLIQEAAMPIPGLSIDDSGILYNDIPLDQCSDGAKLMIGVAISMALNPTVKVILIRDGSLLGPKNMALLQKLVKDKEYMLFIERVADLDQYNSTGQIGIYIQEGAIEFLDGVPVEKVKASAKSKADVKPQIDEAW